VVNASTSTAERQAEDSADGFERRSARPDWPVLSALSLVAFAIHLLFYPGYGFFRDELYFIACSRHLDWGYVDHPPGVALVAWIARHLLGDSLFAMRLVPVVFAALQVLLTGLTAAAMGGRRFAQLLACICVLAAPQYFGSYLNTDMFMDLGWMACAWVAARIFAGESQRLWLLFGVFAGLALEGKHAMAFFCIAFLAGVAVSSQRRMLASRWLWAGIGVAFLLVLPNLIWEYRHQWATYELLANIAKSDKNLVLGPWAFLRSNIDALNIFAMPVWVAGLGWLLFARGGRRFRTLGWTWIFSYIIFLVLKGKDYYLTPVYATLFAGGTVAIEHWLASRKSTVQKLLKPAVAVIILAGGMIAWPFAMPMMPVEQFIRYSQALGVAPKRTETMAVSLLPQQYADMFGWQELTMLVAKVHGSLPQGERERCGILTQNYGEAAAIDYFGRQYGLPHAISGHQSYWMWGPQPYSGECLIVVGKGRQWMEQYFSSFTQAGETFHPLAIPHENHRPIWIAREPKFARIDDVWPKWKLWR
jgi:4-amino-4-deoxy-L-arabinose transferase-like glycosyltransferase